MERSEWCCDSAFKREGGGSYITCFSFLFFVFFLSFQRQYILVVPAREVVPRWVLPRLCVTCSLDLFQAPFERHLAPDLAKPSVYISTSKPNYFLKSTSYRCVYGRSFSCAPKIIVLAACIVESSTF